MSTPASTTRPLRILVIGAGPAAQVLHLPALARLQRHRRLVLTLICDIDTQRAAIAQRQFGFLDASTDAVAAIARDDIDAVYVFGSAQLHYDLGLLALRGGKHLFVEKPIAPSYPQAVTLAQAARCSGRVAAGGHNRRFYASLAAVRARAGNAGWRFAQSVFHRAELGRPPPFGASTWLGANGIHALDALLYMMGGVPVQLWALSGTAETGSSPSTFSALMRWHDGAQGVFVCDNSGGARREEYVFHGLGETYRVDEAGVTCENAAGACTSRQPWTGDGIDAEHIAFLDAIQGGYPPVHSIAAIAPSLFIAQLIEAGFCGEVRVPAETRAFAAAAMPRPSRRAAASQTIAVAPSAPLLAALDRSLPLMRRTALEEIARSDGSRPDVVALILDRTSIVLTETLLDKLPNLAVVGLVGLSFARHRPHLLLSRDIALMNASAAYADSVAEMALGLIILGRRRAFTSHAVLRAGGWSIGAEQRRLRDVRRFLRALQLETWAVRIGKRVLPVNHRSTTPAIARDLRGASVGLIGWGANARALAGRLRGAGAAVGVYSQHASASEISDAGAVPVSLSEALAAEVVSLHRGLTPATRHFLGVAELEKLRPGTLLINLARGALIEPNALLARLRRGDIFACLDSFEEEPLAPHDPLRRLPNVFLTAHIAGGSNDLHTHAVHEIVDQVTGFLQGRQMSGISAQRLVTMT